MRIKTFTLMLLALFVSTLSFAQKNIAPFNKQMLAQRPSMVQKGLQISGQQLMKTSTAAPKFAPVRRAEPVTPPSGGDVLYYTLSGDNYRKSGVERTVKVIFDGDDVYISGLSYFIPDAFVKGTFGEGNTITFSAMQYVGDYSFSDGDASMFMAGTTGKDQLDFTATLSADEKVFTFPSIVGEFYQIGEASGLTAYWKPGVTLTLIEGDVDLPIEPPLDLVTEMYSLSATSEIDESPVSRLVNVGFYGDEVYLQGISADLPDAWIRGTIENNVVTFKTGQLLGAYSSTYNLWFLGWDWTNNCPIDVQFTYDAVNQQFTAKEFLISLKKDDYRNACFEVNGDITISKVVEKPGTPANPAVLNMQFTPKGDLLDISINVSDVEGNGMLPEKLFYKFYSKDAQGATKELTFSKDVYTTLESDLTEIPYELATKEISNSSVALLMDHSDWTEIGLQSIYKGGGESHESEIAWYTINWPVQITLPEGLTIKEHVFKGTTYESGSDIPFTSSLNMAIDGNDLYIQGFGADAGVAETWVKGTKNDDGIYVFKAGQDLGSTNSFRLFFLGYSDEGEVVEDFKLSVDTQNGVYQFLNTALLNVFYTDKSYYYTRFNSDCTISTEGSGPVTPPAGLETKDAFMSGYLNTGTADVVRQKVKIGRDGSDVYVQGIFRTMPEAWAKGTFKDESTITFEPQLIAMTADYTMYYLLGSDDGETIVPLNFSFRQTKNGDVVVEQLAPTFYSVSTSKNELNENYYGYSVGIHTMKATETVPAGLATDKYSLTYEDADKALAAKVIEFGILDNKAYLKGISADAPNAWIVGDVEGTSIKFEAPQALSNDGSVVFISYDAVNTKTMPYFELTWDATAKTLASVGDNMAIVNNSMITRVYYLEEMTHMNASVIADVAATPADPEFENMHFTYYGDFIGFDVKTVSTTGEGLLPEKLFYKMYSKDAADQENPIVFTTDKYTKLTSEMTEIPYGFMDTEDGYDFLGDAVYLNMEEHKSWKQIGIQAIYKGGDAVNASNIVWYTIVQPKMAVLPEGAEVTTHNFSGTTSSSATGTVPFNTTVKLAKVENSIYIQGLQGDAWVRGNLIDENTYTFANGQYLGLYPISETNNLVLFLLGTDAEKNVTNSLIQLNTATNKYEFMTNVLVNATYTDRSFYLLQYDKGCTIDVVETGISTVKADAQFNANAPAYNMAGQRVDKDFKGLVIKGGKKFVSK